MKNFTSTLLALSFLLFFATQSTAASGTATNSGPTVSGYFLGGTAADGMNVDDFLALTPRKYKEQTGQRLSLKERLVMKMAKKNIKRQLKKEGALPASIDLYETEKSFHIGGFLLGLFLGLIGVLISLAFKDKSARRSALMGWGISIALLLLILAAG